jgi:MYXO-CTERM domain-containing protein
MAAQWNFNDVATAGGSVSNVGGFTGSFVGPAGRTVSGGGVSGFAGDYAFDPRAAANTGDGAMTSNTPAFLTALNTVTGGQAMSITYWEFLDSTPNSTAFWGNSPSAAGVGGTRGLNAHSPWGDGNVYFDTAGCCDGTNRISGAMGATIGDWQLVTLIYNAGTRSVYRNTTLVASGSGGLPLATDLDAFIVGNDNLISNLGMDARLDNFTIWSGALTTQEIAALAVRPVPEPSAWMLGMLGLLAAGRRRPRR